jgi:tetratricopeptide (TPR) repeat protein
VARDPLSPEPLDSLGDALRLAGRLPEAEEAYRRALSLDPSDSVARGYLAITHSQKRKHRLAREEFERLQDPAFRLWVTAIVAFRSDDKSGSTRALNEYVSRFPHETVPASVVHAVRGERDEAFSLIDRAYKEHDGRLRWLKVSQLWSANLVGDPRYQAWL